MKFNNQKAATFGLEGESLRKQSGELFLARLQRLTFRLVEGHQASRPLNSKAAMFGLDARIALAIFGILSLTSGAALYKTVRQAKAIALLSDMKEIGNAWETYYLDTKKVLARNNDDNTHSHFYVYKIEDLIQDPGIKGWKGPYLSYEVNDAVKLIYPKIDATAYITIDLLAQTSSWGDTVIWNPVGFCTAGAKCGVWVNISGFNTDDTAEILDDKVDNGDGPTLGKFKWYYTESDGVRNYRYLLNTLPAKNPND